MTQNSGRLDYRIILEMVEPGSRVLDLGCGSGELLELLTREKSAVGQGVDIDSGNVSLCMSRGVSAIHGDLDEGLDDYPDQSFDYVVLNQTLQVVKSPDRVLEEVVRVGKTGIVGFPNFGHWTIRSYLLLKGRMPITPELPYTWYSTPNIHLLTTRDMDDLCKKKSINVKKRIFISRSGEIRSQMFYNLLAVQAIYLIQKAK